jgi:RNA polymerase sigma-70 factor, ECF subfamily
MKSAEVWREKQSCHRHGSNGTGTEFLGEEAALAQFRVAITTMEPLPIAVPNEDHDDWFDITTAITNGDADAFGTFFDAFFPDALRIAHQATGRDESVCMDIVQEAMLKAMRCMKPIPNRQRLHGWMQTVIRSAAYDWLRKETRYRQILLRSQEESNDNHGSPALEDHARLLWLEERLQRLDPGLQQLIHWRYRLGWTLQRIASNLGVQPGAVDGRIRRTLERLRAMAEEEYHD